MEPPSQPAPSQPAPSQPPYPPAQRPPARSPSPSASQMAGQTTIPLSSQELRDIEAWAPQNGSGIGGKYTSFCHRTAVSPSAAPLARHPRNGPQACLSIGTAVRETGRSGPSGMSLHRHCRQRDTLVSYIVTQFLRRHSANRGPHEHRRQPRAPPDHPRPRDHRRGGHRPRHGGHPSLRWPVRYPAGASCRHPQASASPSQTSPRQHRQYVLSLPLHSPTHSPTHSLTDSTASASQRSPPHKCNTPAPPARHQQQPVASSSRSTRQRSAAAAARPDKDVDKDNDPAPRTRTPPLPGIPPPAPTDYD